MIAVLLSGILAMVLSLFGTGLAIRLFTSWGLGQEIRDDGPGTHLKKRGTPSMGGIVFILAAVVAYFAGTLFAGYTPSTSGYLLVLLFLGMGAVGFLDDFIKVYKKRSLGLRARAKLVGQTTVALVFGILALTIRDGNGATAASESFSFVRDIGPHLGWILTLALIALLINGTSNATNLTDGLDGLLAGSATMVFGAYTVIAIWQSNHLCTAGSVPGCYDVAAPLDLAVFAAAVAGGCFGYLWWNASPARIFMGDTGSLALGAAMAGLAVLSRTELLLVVLGALFVAVTLSVMIQVTWFKASRRLTGTGRRLFKMTPLHHHFELAGWAQDTVVIRLWILNGISVAAGVALFYGEWLTH